MAEQSTPAARPAHDETDQVSYLYFPPTSLLRLHNGKLSGEIVGKAPRQQIRESFAAFAQRLATSTPMPDAVDIIIDRKGEHCGDLRKAGAHWATTNRLSERDRIKYRKRMAGAIIVGRYTRGVGAGDLGSQHLGTSLLCIDCDGGGTAQALAHAFRSRRAIVHSTASSTPTSPRCRVYIHLSREVTAVEYSTLAQVIGAALISLGFVIDLGASAVIGRLAYLPMHAANVEPEFIVTGGSPLPVDRLLATRFARATATEQGADQPRGESGSASEHSTVCFHCGATLRIFGKFESETQQARYATSAVLSAVKEIEQADTGNRHETFKAQSLKLAEPCKGIELDQTIIIEGDDGRGRLATIRDVLLGAFAVAKPGCDSEAEGILTWAFTRGRKSKHGEMR